MDEDVDELKDLKDKIFTFFYSIDNNPDGTLTFSEIKTARDRIRIELENTRPEDDDEEIFEIFYRHENWEKVFDALDLDGDKRADFHEFYTATIDYKQLFT